MKTMRRSYEGNTSHGSHSKEFNDHVVDFSLSKLQEDQIIRSSNHNYYKVFSKYKNYRKKLSDQSEKQKNQLDCNCMETHEHSNKTSYLYKWQDTELYEEEHSINDPYLDPFNSVGEINEWEDPNLYMETGDPEELFTYTRILEDTLQNLDLHTELYSIEDPISYARSLEEELNNLYSYVRKNFINNTDNDTDSFLCENQEQNFDKYEEEYITEDIDTEDTDEVFMESYFDKNNDKTYSLTGSEEYVIFTHNKSDITLDEEFFKNPNKRLSIMVEAIEKYKDGILATPLSNVYPETYLKRLLEIYDETIAIKKILKDSNYDSSEKNPSDRIFRAIVSLPLRVELPIHFSTLERIENIQQRLFKQVEGMEVFKKVAKSILAYLFNLRETINNSKKGALYLKDLEKSKEITSRVFLLIGKPGVGKSFFASFIANTLDLPLIKIDAIGNDHHNVMGLSSHWGGGRHGLLASELISKGRMPSVILIDEIDKSGSSNDHDFIDVVNRITDPDYIARDNFLGVDLYHIKTAIIIMTANDKTKIRDYIESRANVIEINDNEINYRKLLDRIILEDLCKRVKKNYRREIEIKSRDQLISLLENCIKCGNWGIREVNKFLDESVELYFYERVINKLSTSFDKYLISELDKFMQRANRKTYNIGYV